MNFADRMARKPLPNRIREWRRKRQFTLKQLADEMKTTPQTVQRLEVGNMTVSIAWLERAAGALACQTTDLLSTRPTPSRDNAFLDAIQDAVIVARRTTPNPQDALYALAEELGTLARMISEHRDGHRPALDVYLAAARLAGAAMRVGVDHTPQRQDFLGAA